MGGAVLSGILLYQAFPTPPLLFVLPDQHMRHGTPRASMDVRAPFCHCAEHVLVTRRHLLGLVCDNSLKLSTHTHTQHQITITNISIKTEKREPRRDFQTCERNSKFSFRRTRNGTQSLEYHVVKCHNFFLSWICYACSVKSPVGRERNDDKETPFFFSILCGTPLMIWIIYSSWYAWLSFFFFFFFLVLLCVGWGCWRVRVCLSLCFVHVRFARWFQNFSKGWHFWG